MQTRAWVLSCAMALSGGVLLPAPVSAQRLVSIVPFTFGSITMNSSAQHVVNDTAQRLVADDTDDLVDLYVHTVATGTLRRLSRLQLVGAPETAATAAFEVLSISDDGRFLAYLTRRYGSDQRQLPPVLARYDIATGTRVVVRDAAFDVFSNPTMSRDGSTFAWIGANSAVHVATVGQTPLVVGLACPPTDDCASRPALTSDGSRVLYLVLDAVANVTQLETFDRPTNARATYPEAAVPGAWHLTTDASGRYVAIFGVPHTSRFLDLATRRAEELPIDATAISTDGRYLLVFDGTFDRRSSSVLRAGGDGSVAMSADGRQLLVRFPTQHLLLDLDGDNDGMRDPWETVYGLDPSTAADAADDPDGDGLSNREEFDAGSHPRGTYRRVFAEGVQGSGFQTDMHVMTSIRAYGVQVVGTPIVVSFLGDDGSRASRTMSGAIYPTDDGIATVPGLVTSASFSMLVESQAPFAAERRTSWGGPVVRGVHGSSGTVPSTRWYFAEGATTGRFQLFYLLANQGGTPAAVTIEYLLATGERTVRSHVVPALSRYTVWVNQEGGPLGSAEVAAQITSTVPIVAERSMYLNDADGSLGAGASSAGVTRAGQTWLFAEGATGPLFDSFLTLLNPGDAPAALTATYQLPDGTAIDRTHMVPAGRRYTIWVNREDPRLSDATFSTRLEADGDVVAERAIWWRTAPGAPWTEGHAEIGAATTSPVWLAPNVGESDFVLMANHSAEPARVQVTLYTHAGGGAGSAIYDIPAGSRATCWPVQDMGNGALPPGRYEAIVGSLQAAGGPSRAGLVVEVASYTPGLRAGTVSLATPLPDAPPPR